jgi:mevalonate kinase
MKSFRSNGKLLLTAEYVVLDGAKALALPTKYGQSLTVEPISEAKVVWKSIDYTEKVWFECELSLDEIAALQTPRNEITKRLIEILIAAKQLNPNFLSASSGFQVTTKLDFPENWGLGSSSTLINNIADWANVNPYELLALTFGGSGYDIACAQNTSAILYTLLKAQNEHAAKRNITTLNFNPSFNDQLFFIHLNQKQDSREGIKRYHSVKYNLGSTISEINKITEHIVACDTISEFTELITTHEEIISKLINLPTIKASKFRDVYDSSNKNHECS